MTEARMVRLAWHGALEIWGHVKDILDANPGDEIMKAHERKAWAELQEVSAKLKAIEDKEAENGR